MRRRTILIEQPPEIWIADGLIYCDFGVQDGSVIAFRPSAWFATSAIGQQITKEWLDSGTGVVPFVPNDVKKAAPD